MRNTLALRRLSPDAPALGSEEKLRFLRLWLLCLATALASVFEPLGREDARPRVWQLMLDRLAQPQFWNAALTIATRQHAQLLQMHDTLEELETGTESLATGEHQSPDHNTVTFPLKVVAQLKTFLAGCVPQVIRPCHLIGYPSPCLLAAYLHWLCRCSDWSALVTDMALGFLPGSSLSLRNLRST